METRKSGDRPALRRTNPLVERRFVVTGLETRAGEDDGPKVLVGYAAKFDKPSTLRYFTEVIRAGAFSVAIDEGDDVRALFNHDVNLVLGRTKSGTLTLQEDQVGLRVEITLPDTQLARDLCTSIERGDVDQMSFAFVVIEERWTEEVSEDAEGRSVRTVLRELLSVRLYDVSPVTFPAYDETEIGVRDLDAFVEARRAGLSADSLAALNSLLADAGVAPVDDSPAGGARTIDTLERELRQAAA